jgi:hypothetical protein
MVFHRLVLKEARCFRRTGYTLGIAPRSSLGGTIGSALGLTTASTDWSGRRATIFRAIDGAADTPIRTTIGSTIGPPIGSHIGTNRTWTGSSGAPIRGRGQLHLERKENNNAHIQNYELSVLAFQIL